MLALLLAVAVIAQEAIRRLLLEACHPGEDDLSHGAAEHNHRLVAG